MDFSNRFSETLASARMQDRMELKALVDFYATESDKNNQDCYVEIFRPDIKLNVYFGGAGDRGGR